MSVTETNKQLARDYFKAFLAADETWWRDHIAPEFRRHDPGLPFEVVGPQAGATHEISCRYCTGLTGYPARSLSM